MTGQEAWQAVLDGWFVTRPGYVYGNGIYFAYGTFPGCVRTGNIDQSAVERFSDWEKLSFKDLILRTGFYPSWCSMYEHCKGTQYELDSVRNEPDMVMWMVDCKYVTEDFKNPFRTKEIWEEFFNKDVENNDRSKTG